MTRHTTPATHTTPAAAHRRGRPAHALRMVSALVLSLSVACADPTAPATPTPIDDLLDARGNRITAATEWEGLTRTIIGRRQPNPILAARIFALVTVAQYNAVVAAEQSMGARRPSASGAAAGAAAAVLSAIFSVEQPVIDSVLGADATFFPSRVSEQNADFAAGVTVGRTSAAAVLARAATDNSTLAYTGTIAAAPGVWTPAPAPAVPAGARWGEVKPWFMTSGAQFRPAAPPAFGSATFQTALAEVRQFTESRTPEQLAVAKFWDADYGPGGPAGYFGMFGANLAAQRRDGERATTRALALMHMAIVDASIGCFDAKYHYLVLRPNHADASLAVAVPRPNHPSYPSAHSCLSAAGAGVLASQFPDAENVLGSLVTEAGMARIYAGLHYRFDVDAGRKLGESVAALALRLAPPQNAPIPLN